jgi:hypothetical protein
MSSLYYTSDCSERHLCIAAAIVLNVVIVLCAAAIVLNVIIVLCAAAIVLNVIIVLCAAAAVPARAPRGEGAADAAL